jgi:iron(III) transport system ATP-binding protein
MIETSAKGEGISKGSKAANVVFENVSKVFGDFTAVDRVSFTVEAGTLVTLLGPSGCGKTTTLRMIAGLDSASSGRVLIGGKDVTRLAASQRDVSMVFQSYALFPHLSVIENVAYGLQAGGVRKDQAQHQAREKLALVGLAGLELRLPSELSGGQQQRVAVARALVLEPQVLLFDEPLSNLDAKLRRKVRDDIRSLQQAMGLTVVYVTHDQSEALAVSDRVIVMSNARIAQIGSPRELYERPADRFLADFIGDANLIQGEVVQDGAAQVFVAGSLRLPLHASNVRGPALFAVRPQRLTMQREAVSSPHIQGTLLKTAYLGTHLEHNVSTEFGDMLIIDADVDRDLQPNEAVYISLDSRAGAVVPA